MTDQVMNYKCPACMGPLHYDGKTGKLECEYCGSSYSVEEIEQMAAEQDAVTEEKMAAEEKSSVEENNTAGEFSGAEGKEDTEESVWESTTEEWTDSGMKAYICPSCGAELLVDETTAATSCPYCGNPTVVPGQMKGALKPEYIIPFKVDKKAAKEALKNHYKHKWLLPKRFISENHIEEMKGVYVPFWLYDGSAHAEGEYEGMIDSTYTQGNYRITKTQHYAVEREGDISFERIPADASSKMPDDLMDSIEPYNYNEMKEFSMAYLPGYMADKYDVSAEEDASRAMERARKSALYAMEGDVSGYDRKRTIHEHVTVKQGKASYALMPVWLLNTKWKGENYVFAMNGQTGKMVGNLPTAKGKFWGAMLGITAAMEALMAVITFVM